MINRFDDREAIERYLPVEGGNRPATVSGRAGELWRRVERAVLDYPKQSHIAALTAGAVLGWITKRR